MIGRRVAACALLGLAALLTLVAACSVWSGASRLTAREGDRASAEAAAAAFVRAYGEFDYRRAEHYTARLAALTTGELHEALASAAVDRAALAHRRTSAAFVESASVTSLSGGAASVAVRSRQDRAWVDPVGGETFREAVTQHASVRLIRGGERWLVAELELIGEEPAGARVAR